MLKTFCGICGHELIEGGEHEGNNVGELEINLSCSNCGASVIYTIYGCVDCDVCEHRSETCLCDISEDDEECPLVKNN